MVPVSSPAESSGGGLEAIRENRDALKDLAESDLRSAKWARLLLDAAEDADREGSV